MNETRRLIEETAARIFKDLCTQETINAAETGAWPTDLWSALEESGLTLAAIPEDRGGAGGDLGDSLAVLKWAGRCAAPLPLAETLVGAWMLSESGMSVPPGPIGVSTDRHDSLELRLVEGGWLLSGSLRSVPWPNEVRNVVVLATDGADDRRVCLVNPETGAPTRGADLAGEPRGDFTFDEVIVAPGRCALAPDSVTPESVLRMGALCKAATMAGALERVLELTVEHANVRVQFGRPIGAFQAIRQQIALLATQVAAANRAAQIAVEAAERGVGEIEIAVAKARVGEAAALGASIAHQVHGAMGITYEHTLHHFTRRIWTWRDDFGPERHWERDLGRKALANGADALWPFVTSV